MIIKLHVKGSDIDCKIDFVRGQNSFGEPGWFVHEPPEIFKTINGWPDYGVEAWLGSRGYEWNWE